MSSAKAMSLSRARPELLSQADTMRSRGLSAAQLILEYPWLALGARRLPELPEATSTMTGPRRA